jgi:hypothetical protein
MRRRLFGLAAILLSLSFGLIVAEIVLRIAGYSQPEFYQADETFGYALIPGMEGNYRKEGRSFVRINSNGFRDIERSIENRDDVFRIAVIGDSYVEGFQVEANERFTAIAEELLNRDCGRQVELMPFGVSGYGTAQQLLMLREKVLRYSPDVVVLLITTNNDVSDNARELKQTPIPYFVERDGELVLDNGFREERRFIARSSPLSRAGVWFTNNLRVIQAIGELSTRIKYWYKSAFVVSAADAPRGEIGIDNQIYLEPQTDVWKKAWIVTERLIEEMRNEAVRNNARFFVMTASNGVQVLPDVKQREAFARSLGVSDLTYPNRRIAGFAAEKGIPSFDLVPTLSQFASSQGVHLHGFDGNIGYGHWNQTGHRVAGEAAASFLCSEIK